MKEWFKNLDGRLVYAQARWHVTGHLDDFGRLRVDASRATYVTLGERVFGFAGMKVLKKERGFLMCADEHRVYTFSIND